MAAHDHTGKRFGRLVVQRRGNNRGGKAAWICLCDCGTTCEVRAAVLVRGGGESCGYLARELLVKRATTHGRTRSREYAAWRRIINRAGKREGYEGVTVCERWQTFKNFLADMGPMPADRPTIDRERNDRGYEPGNCRWASVTEQNRNKSNNVRLTLGDETVLAIDWARRLGMSLTSLLDRINKFGWTVERALTTPPMNRGARGKKAA